MASEWDASDFESKFQDLFRRTDAELVTFDNSKGIFIKREDFTKYVASMAEVSSKKLGEAVDRKAKAVRDRSAAIENQLSKVNEMLVATTKRENALRLDLEDAEDNLKRALDESKEVKETYEIEKKRLLKLIEEQRVAVKNLQNVEKPGSAELLALERAKGKKLQDELKMLQKEKGSKLSETVVLKMRVASFKAALMEEGSHQIEIRNKFEDALKEQKSLPEMVFEYSEKALKAIGLSNLLDIFASGEKSPKAMAWDLIELARVSDERNKLKSRDLATLVYQTVKTVKPRQRARYIQMIQDTAKAITIGSREDIESAKEIWSKEKSSVSEVTKEDSLMSESLFDAEDPLNENNPEVQLSRKKKKNKRFNSLKSFGLTCKLFLRNTFKPIFECFKPFKRPSLADIKKRFTPSWFQKVKIFTGSFTCHVKQSTRYGFNSYILNKTKNGYKGYTPKPWTPLRMSLIWCYAESAGLSYSTAVATVPANLDRYRFSDDEWEVLRPLMDPSDLLQDVEVLNKLKKSGEFMKRNIQIVNFYNLK